MTFPAHLPNSSLPIDQVPGPDAGWQEIRQFAYTYYGYDHWNETMPLASLANSRIARTLTEARACLFFEYRRQVHSPEAADSPDRQAWIRELIERIREFVQAGRLD